MEETPSQVVPTVPLQSQQTPSSVVAGDSKIIKVVRIIANSLISLGYILQIAGVIGFTGLMVLHCIYPDLMYVFPFVYFALLVGNAICNDVSFFVGLVLPTLAFIVLPAIIFIVTIFGKQTKFKKVIHWASAIPLLPYVLQNLQQFIGG